MIKRRLNNQKRLILQGEIEDIILHAPRTARDLWIYVIVGVSDALEPNELAHLKQLHKYAAYRSTGRANHAPDQYGLAGINVEVMVALVPSLPASVG